MPHFYSVQDFATITGYKVSYVRKMCETGRLGCCRPNGGRILISQDDLMAFINGAGKRQQANKK